VEGKEQAEGLPHRRVGRLNREIGAYWSRNAERRISFSKRLRSSGSSRKGATSRASLSRSKPDTFSRPRPAVDLHPNLLARLAAQLQQSRKIKMLRFREQGSQLVKFHKAKSTIMYIKPYEYGKQIERFLSPI
jgi:predicted ATPase